MLSLIKRAFTSKQGSRDGCILLSTHTQQTKINFLESFFI